MEDKMVVTGTCCMWTITIIDVNLLILVIYHQTVRVQVAPDIQADDEKKMAKMAKKLSRQQVPASLYI